MKHTRYLAGVDVNVKARELGFKILDLFSIHSRALTFQGYACLNFHSMDSILKGQIQHFALVFDNISTHLYLTLSHFHIFSFKFWFQLLDKCKCTSNAPRKSNSNRKQDPNFSILSHSLFSIYWINAVFPN